MNFIKTSSEDTYKKLMDLGFTFLGKEDGFYRFINDGGKAQFTQDESKTISRTNIING